MTRLPITFVGGSLHLHDRSGRRLTELDVLGVDEEIGVDFTTYMAPISEHIGQVKLSFTSGDYLRLGLDVLGNRTETVIGRLRMRDSAGVWYEASKEIIFVARGQGILGGMALELRRLTHKRR